MRGLITLSRALGGSPHKCCVGESCVFNNMQITMKKKLITYFWSMICSCTTLKEKTDNDSHKNREQLGN